MLFWIAARVPHGLEINFRSRSSACTGPDTMYVVGRSVAQGRQAGFVSVLGICSGAFIHTTAAAFGLSAILFTSAIAFSMVKWAGALYLAYLGLQMFIDKRPKTQEHASIVETKSADSWTIYKQGLFTNLLNPEVVMFFMAFIPQFVARDHASNPLPFLFLGSVFIFTGTLWCLFLAAMAATVSKGLRRRSKSLRLAKRFTGLFIMSLGIKLAIQGQR
jgi:threonine/homoserine/homoserine lactone efflux protein